MLSNSGVRGKTLLGWTLLLGALLAAPPLRPFAIFLLPGLLVRALPTSPRMGWVAVWARAIATSLSFWIVGVWASSWIGISLTTLFWVVSPIAAVVWLALLAKREKQPAGPRIDHLSAIGLIGALLLFLLPFFLTPAPPGADMSMHGYVTRLTVEADGVPGTYEPYLPLKHFGAFSIGFHTLAALVTSLTGGLLQLHRALLLMDCLVYFLLFFFLWAALTARFSERAAFVLSAMAILLSRDPQHFLAWGGTPTVLSIALITCGVPTLRRPREGAYRELMLAGLWVSAGFLSHPIPAVILAIIYTPYALYLVYEALRRAELPRLLMRFAAIGVICLICVSWFIARYENTTSGDELEWLRVWNATGQERWHGSLSNALVTLPEHLSRNVLGALAIPLVFAILLAALRGDREDRTDLYFVLALCGIVVNGKYQVLPHSEFIYPDRASAMLPIFAAGLIGAQLPKVRAAIASILPRRSARLLGYVLLFAMLGACILGNCAFYLRPGLAEASVTEDDLRAFDWIGKNTKQVSHFFNNYTDAGLWIPAIAARTVSVPHVNIVNWSETKLALATLPAQYIYIGAKPVYPFPFSWTPPGVESLRPAPELVFQSGGARVYRLPHTLTSAIAANVQRLVAGRDELTGEIRLLSPADGKTLSSPPIVLRWDPSGCELFNVQMSLSPNLDNPLLVYNSYPSLQITDGRCDVSALFALIPPRAEVYWRIRGLPVVESPLGHESRTSAFRKPGAKRRRGEEAK